MMSAPSFVTNTILSCATSSEPCPTLIRLSRAPKLYSTHYTPYTPNGAESLGVSLSEWTHFLVVCAFKHLLPLYFASKVVFFGVSSLSGAGQPLSHDSSPGGFQALFSRGVGLLREVVWFVVRGCLLTFGVLAAAYFLIAIGRYNNKVYMTFFRNLDANNQNPIKNGTMYEITHQLPHFVSTRSSQPLYFNRDKHTFLNRIASKLMVNGFGLFLAYPGASQTFKKAYEPVIYSELQRKIKMLNMNNFIIKVSPGISLHAQYYTVRNGLKSQKLLIYFSGNGELMEVSSRPYELIGTGNDVLLFNRPGFGVSSGKPWPENEVNSVLAVMEFAQKYLKYNVADIIIYGWSIGGFSVSVAMNHFPNVYGMVIDGSFDEIARLTYLMFPEKLYSTIDCAFDLYMPIKTIPYLTPPGVLAKNFVVVIRIEDEVMSTNFENGVPQLHSSRSVHLALKLLMIAYKDQIKSKEAIDYILKVLTNVNEYQRVMLARYKSILDTYIAKHVLLVPGAHSGPLNSAAVKHIFSLLDENSSLKRNEFKL